MMVCVCICNNMKCWVVSYSLKVIYYFLFVTTIATRLDIHNSFKRRLVKISYVHDAYYFLKVTIVIILKCLVRHTGIWIIKFLLQKVMIVFGNGSFSNEFSSIGSTIEELLLYSEHTINDKVSYTNNFYKFFNMCFIMQTIDQQQLLLSLMLQPAIAS